MKAQFKKSISNLIPIFLILAAMVVFGFGCDTPPKSDPLAGFHRSSLGNLDANKAITDDYQNYIQKFSPDEKKYLGPVFFFEDGTSQHAVRIETDIHGTDCWYHILFYDKDNKRIKVIKYFYGRYIS